MILIERPRHNRLDRGSDHPAMLEAMIKAKQG